MDDVEEIGRLRQRLDDGWAALRVIRRTVETFGPPGALISEQEVIRIYGSEYRHEAQAISDAIEAIFSNRQRGR